MKTFEFSGELGASKSLMNRALIIQKYSSQLQIQGHSTSRDVVHLQRCLSQLDQKTFDVGEGGTTFRFLTFFLSRHPGKWKLQGSERLMSRPSSGMEKILQQLSIKNIHKTATTFEFESTGWSWKNPITVEGSETSQFASGLLLNAWNLNQDFEIQLLGNRVSDAYLEMTLSLLRQTGMQILSEKSQLSIAKNQTVRASTLSVEPDLSSAFVVAALAVARGNCVIKNFPEKSLQPDAVFFDILKKMGAKVSFESGHFHAQRTESLKAVEVSLRNSPDLFPVLAVLVTRAAGVSRLYGAPQLIHKESNRLAKTSELLKLMRVHHEILEDGMVIHGKSSHHHEFFEFDPDQDHRLAFAAALAKSIGYRLRVLSPEVVDKSFPKFWDLISGGAG